MTAVVRRGHDRRPSGHRLADSRRSPWSPPAAATARPVANSRSIQPADSADILAVAGDIADPAVADGVIGGAVEKFGRVDTLVNNAGMFIAKPFTEYTEADFAAKISLNLAGFFHVSQRAVRQMLAQAAGTS